MVNFSMPILTWICLGIIAIAFVVCLLLVIKFKRSDTLNENKRTIEYFPTLISTLGVLGTFIGITIGLMAFDTSNLDQSIPGLLDGLKTAFLTSLAGMFLSMLLSYIIGRKQDIKDGGVSDINEAAGVICQAVKQMREQNKVAIESLISRMEVQENELKTFSVALGSAVESMQETTSSMASSVGRLEENATAQTITFNSVKKHTEEMAEYTHHIPELLDVTCWMNKISIIYA